MKSCVISLAAPVVNMKRILCPNWLPKRTDRVCNYWKLPAVESQKSLEDRQNKENRNDCSGFIVLQTQLAFVLGSRSWKVILDSDVMDTSVFRESKIRTNFIEPFPKQNRTKLCKLVNKRCNDKKSTPNWLVCGFLSIRGNGLNLTQ